MEILNAKEVSCEYFRETLWSGALGAVKTCHMDQDTVINDQNVTISTRNESIGELRFSNNRKIFFLPVGVAEFFPNLKAYNANGCAIKGISKENFKGLHKLMNLYLAYNEIEKIETNTFGDLTNLAILGLREKNLI